MRTKTCISVYPEDRKWCKDNNIALAYVFKKGIESLKNPDISVDLGLKIERLSLILANEITKRQMLEERYAKLVVEFMEKANENNRNRKDF